jgi:hypothetical protein
MFGTWLILNFAGNERTLQRGFLHFFIYLSQISVCISTGTRRLPFKSVPVHCRSSSLSVTGPCTQSCAVHRELHYTRCKKMNHGRFYSWWFCCLFAGVLSEVSNKFWNKGMKNSTSSTWLLRITVRHCFEKSAIGTQWHGANSTAVIAPTSQI